MKGATFGANSKLSDRMAPTAVRFGHAPGLAIYRLHRPARISPCSPLFYGAGGVAFWPSPHSWAVSPLCVQSGDTHVQHGQPASSQERKCAAAIPTPAALRPTLNTFTCATDPQGARADQRNSWWWLKRNSERVFNDAKTAQSRNTEITLRRTSGVPRSLTWYPNVITSAPPAPGVVVDANHYVLWPLSRSLAQLFLRFFRLHRSSAPLRDRNPDLGAGFSKGSGRPRR